VTIERLEVKSQMQGDGIYMIFTDKGVFVNQYSLVKLKFNSSDLYGYLKLNECYRIKYWLFKSRPLNLYPNILDAKQIQCIRNGGNQ
jgi:hypothetical protein